MCWMNRIPSQHWKWIGATRQQAINQANNAHHTQHYMASLNASELTHWGRATHICVSTLPIMSSDNGLSPGRRQAIIWTNAGLLLIEPLGTNLSEILIEIYTFSLKTNAFENVVWKRATILSRPQWVKLYLYLAPSGLTELQIIAAAELVDTEKRQILIFVQKGILHNMTEQYLEESCFLEGNPIWLLN